MRLLVVSNLYPPNVIGGYERLCYDAVSGLARRDHRITVLTSSFGNKVEDFPGQVVRRSLRLLIGDGIYRPFEGDAAAREAINRANLTVLRQSIAETRPEIIFAWNLFFLDRSMLDALAGSGIGVVLMLTDNWLITMEKPHFWASFFRDHVLGDRPFAPTATPAAAARDRRSSLLARGRRWLLNRVGPRTPPAVSGIAEARVNFPFRAIFGSNFVRDLYDASGIAFAHGHVVHNGVSQDGYATRPARDRTALVEPGELRLLFVGRLVDLKGVHTTVEALPLLSPDELGVTRVRLAIVGDMRDAAYVRQLRETIERSGAANRITMQPPVPEEALFDLFQAHDLYLFPSLYEPFSLTLIHALASGIPTIASRAGGNVEIVREGETGLLFEKSSAQDLARAVRALACDPALRARVATAGRHLARTFTVDRMVNEMEDVLRRGA